MPWKSGHSTSSSAKKAAVRGEGVHWTSPHRGLCAWPTSPERRVVVNRPPRRTAPPLRVAELEGQAEGLAEAAARPHRSVLRSKAAISKIAAAKGGIVAVGGIAAVQVNRPGFGDGHAKEPGSPNRHVRLNIGASMAACPDRDSHLSVDLTRLQIIIRVWTSGNRGPALSCR